MRKSNNVGAQTDQTTAPVVASQNNKAEWCDSPGAYGLFGLRRSLLYALWRDNKIAGVSLRQRGRQRGKRLWSCDSIRRYLASQMEGAK